MPKAKIPKKNAEFFEMSKPPKCSVLLQEFLCLQLSYSSYLIAVRWLVLGLSFICFV